MSGNKLLGRYALRLVRREWRRFVLPTVSLMITATVLSSTLFLVAGSQLLLREQARTLLGGDIVLESTAPIAVADTLAKYNITPTATSEIIEFSTSLQSEAIVTAVSMQVVADTYPLLGEIGVLDGTYRYPTANEIYLDAKAAERLQVTVGETVQLADASFTVAGIITRDPRSLFSSFRFLPRAVLGTEGFARTKIDPSLLRAEYESALVVPELPTDALTRLQAVEKDTNGFIQVRVASDGGGLAVGLGVVRDFLVVAVLVTAILATVNVYASTLYFVTAERKSFAILLSLGFTRQRLLAVLGIALGCVVLCAGFFGVLLGYGLFTIIIAYIATALALTLPSPAVVFYGAVTIALLVLLSVSAFVPTVGTILRLNPKQLLIGEERVSIGYRRWSLLLMVLCTFLPIYALSVFLLESWLRGAVVVGVVVGVYVVMVLVFGAGLRFLYTIRRVFPFVIRSIIAQKSADGLFGVVSFGSLFMALGSLCTLVLTQATLVAYLTEDLSTTVPSTYVIDVQPSQKPTLEAQFPELTLFSNIPARIIAIDDMDIQAGIASGDTTIDRELGREFNITARADLLSSESLTQGIWHAGRSGEISIDETFAKRANIALGSKLVFGIQGFEVAGVVTSFRATDSRSGLPFFYFVLAPEDLVSFPQTYFGYAHQTPDEQQALVRFLATNMPNVTVIETQAIASLLIALTELLLLVIFVVTVPPLLIAVLLIVTMIISSYASRRREGGRLRALGTAKSTMIFWYLLETVSITLVATGVAYVTGVAATSYISTQFLQVGSTVWFDPLLSIGVLVLVLLTALLGIGLVKSDTMPLRELLSYGER